MKKIFFLLALIVLFVSAQAQLKITKGLKTSPENKLITNKEVGTLDGVDTTKTVAAQFNETVKTASIVAYSETLYNKTEVDAFRFPFAIHFDGGAITSPADGTAYYIGVPLALAPTIAVNNRYITLPVDCTLIGYSIAINANTAGTNETYSIYVRKNNTTDDLLGSSFVASSVNTYSKFFAANNLNIAYSANDKIEIKIVTPTWATNPASLVHSVILFFKAGKL